MSEVEMVGRSVVLLSGMVVKARYRVLSLR